MLKLLSLPPNLVNDFHELEGVDHNEWFCTSDPVGRKLGSGGGTTWLLREWEKQVSKKHAADKRILLHAGGQSRRLPGYAPSGKILTPIPVFRWARGQRIGQNLLSLQLPLYERILQMAPDGLKTLVASGDVLIRVEKPLQSIPDVDVVCYGMWVNPQQATHHGVFMMNRQQPTVLDFMLQKPSLQQLEQLAQTHLCLMDVGIWLFSDRAIQLLKQRSLRAEGPLKEGEPAHADIRYYDLYSDYGRALGVHPGVEDDELNALSVAILPLDGGEFYHYGTSRELLSSTETLQNKVYDQTKIIHRKVKPNPSIFVQNAEVKVPFTTQHDNIWIENSHVPDTWQLGRRHILTGVPQNDWQLSLPDGVCVDVVPVGETQWAIRPYGFDDVFKGALTQPSTLYCGTPFVDWCAQRGIDMAQLEGSKDDLQAACIFPVVNSVDDAGKVLRWMVAEPDLKDGWTVWNHSEKWSADQLSARANLKRLYTQRENFRCINLPQLAANYEQSVFYQLDLADVAQQYVQHGLPTPQALPDEAPLMQRIHNRMLRAQIIGLPCAEAQQEKAKAFDLLREGLLYDLYSQKQQPQLNVYSDQIVWGRSPVRIDVAGGWTDTPPYSLLKGGNVVNLAIELNGQPPLQVYVKPCRNFEITLRSIDMGAMEVVRTYDELQHYCQVGSPFSIPKAALVLAGFHPSFSQVRYASLEAQLQAFGTGLEITLLSAIPAGSGLGTSSILASTVLGSLNDFCGLQWDKNEICRRTLALEQLLTTGGGWQDQYGGVLQGVKLLQTDEGFAQCPSIHWLPQHLFTAPEYRDCHLLYYTGITRTAKGILEEIVRSMFLNSSPHLRLLHEMKQHALDMAEAVQRDDFERYGTLVAKSWKQNQLLDSGTNPPAVEAITQLVKDYTLGYKLPGAGGGGYLYMVAKDPQAAVRIRQVLNENAPNERARFVEMTLSGKGFQVSRS